MASHLLHPAFGTDRGRVRQRNEDAVGYHYPDDFQKLHDYGALFVLADGVGGLSNGAEVAEYAIRRLIELYYEQDPSHPAEMLKTSIAKLNDEIYRVHHTKGATTLVALLIRQNEAIVAHVGDSRAYHGRPNILKLITQDHAAEVIDPDGKPRRKLTRALGYRAHVEASIHVHSFQEGDCFLLLTDGATRYFDTPGIYKLLSENPKETIQRIIERSNEAGGMDNISAVITFIGGSLADADALTAHLQQLEAEGVRVEVPPAPPLQDVPQTNRLQPLSLWILFFLALMLTAFFAFSPEPNAFFVATQATAELSFIGQHLHFEMAALTYLEVGENTSAFMIEPAKAYFVQDILTNDEIWIGLYDAETARLGWIRLADLPAYHLLP